MLRTKFWRKIALILTLTTSLTNVSNALAMPTKSEEKPCTTGTVKWTSVPVVSEGQCLSITQWANNRNLSDIPRTFESSVCNGLLSGGVLTAQIALTSLFGGSTTDLIPGVLSAELLDGIFTFLTQIKAKEIRVPLIYPDGKCIDTQISNCDIICPHCKKNFNNHEQNGTSTIVAQLSCGHIYCKECLEDLFKNSAQGLCEKCNRPYLVHEGSVIPICFLKPREVVEMEIEMVGLPNHSSDTSVTEMKE